MLCGGEALSGALLPLWLLREAEAKASETEASAGGVEVIEATPA
jgi:hypothetical protein